MYYTDTLSGEISAFDYCRKDGTISNRSVAYKLGEDEGLPDGMTIDSEDMVWAAVWGGGKVIRIDPERHEKLLEIYLPVPHVSSVAFGGAGLTELFITSARLGLSEEQLKKYPLSGGLFVIETGVRGTKLHRFGA
jgi:sugar lactone lactonase YvrE